VKIERLHELIDAYLDDGLTPEQGAELSAILTHSAEARREYWNHAALHGVLPEAMQLQWLSRAGSGLASPETLRTSESRSSARRSWFKGIGIAAAACALIVLGWFAASRIPGTDAGAPVAVLERAPGAWWEGMAAPERGDDLRPGLYRLKRGAAQIRFRSGAQLIVEAPSEFTLLDRNAAKLSSGQVTGFVPPEARGFRIQTPSLTLIDLGTAFGLKVPPAGPAEAHVFEGEIELVAEIAGSKRLVDGEAVRLLDSGFDPIPLRTDAFLTAERLAARESRSTRRRMDQWHSASAHLSRDPAALVHYTCEQQERWDTTLRNFAMLPGADHHTGMIIGASWTEGRWPGKGAVAFREPGDRIRFEIPGRHRHITLLASVCVDTLPNDFNALLMTENFAQGDLRWQLLRDGRLQLGIRTSAPREGRASETGSFEYFTTEPIIDESRYGRWVNLVTVYDGDAGTVSHYVDGDPAGISKVTRKTDILLGSLELGNWGIQLDDPKWTWTKSGGAAFTKRNFFGKLDEFAVVARALKPAEVSEISSGW
jgi:hypothetical protein